MPWCRAAQTSPGRGHIGQPGRSIAPPLAVSVAPVITGIVGSEEHNAARDPSRLAEPPIGISGRMLNVLRHSLHHLGVDVPAQSR